MALPAWFATREHVPTLTTVTVVFDTAQTAGVAELNATGRPEVAIADTPNGAAP